MGLKVSFTLIVKLFFPLSVSTVICLISPVAIGGIAGIIMHVIIIIMHIDFLLSHTNAANNIPQAKWLNSQHPF